MKKLFTVLLLMMLMVSIAKGVTSIGDYTWKVYGDHWYAPTQAPGYWSLASAEALALVDDALNPVDGHLVTINDVGENEWLALNFDGYWGYGDPEVFASQALWIGYQDVIEQSWHWESGEPVTYINEASFWGNPVPGEHAYIHTQSHFSPGTWNMNAQHDDPYNEGLWLHGIIEMPAPTVIPAPGAIVLGGIGVMLVGWIRRRIERKV